MKHPTVHEQFLFFWQNRLGELEGVKPCKKLSATKLSVQTSQRQSSAVVQEIGDEEANEIEKEEEQQEEETKEADEKAIDLKTNEEGLGLGELCEDCAVGSVATCEDANEDTFDLLVSYSLAKKPSRLDFVIARLAVK